MKTFVTMLMLVVVLASTFAKPEPARAARWVDPPLQREAVLVTFQKLQIRYQSVEVRDPEGAVLGVGDVRANVSGSSNGRTNGKVELEMPNLSLLMRFTDAAPPEIFFDENGEPIEVILTGWLEATQDGRTERSEAIFVFHRIPGELKWQNVVLWSLLHAPMYLTVEGDVRFR